MAEQRKPLNQTRPKEYFYFDLADEGHEHLLQKELQEAHDNPLASLEEVTKIEY